MILSNDDVDLFVDLLMAAARRNLRAEENRISKVTEVSWAWKG